MKVVFFGTPHFAVPSLRALLAAGHEVRAVVTQPDRAKGRSRSVTQPPPVKVAALETGLTVHQPERPRGDDFEAVLRSTDAEIGIVVAYGHILAPHVLAIPPRGMLNVHASLLPRWRGAAPIQWAVLSNDPHTGVALMQMEAGLDTGPVFAEARTPIHADETSGQLLGRLAELGAQLLGEALPQIAAGALHAVPQAEAGATYAAKIDRALARLDFGAPAPLVAARIRAFDPAPGAWAQLGAHEVKLFGGATAPAEDLADNESPAGTARLVGQRLLIRTGDGGGVFAATVQSAGRPRVGAAEFAHGHAALLASERFA